MDAHQRRAALRMRQSMKPRNRMNSTAVSCEVSSTSATESAGSPAFTQAWRSNPTMARFEFERRERATQEGRVARLEAEPRRGHS